MPSASSNGLKLGVSMEFSPPKVARVRLVIVPPGIFPLRNTSVPFRYTTPPSSRSSHRFKAVKAPTFVAMKLLRK